MALTTRVTARLSDMLLRALTNPDSPGASAVDSTRLANAAEDVEADFKIHAGVEYDDTDARHVATAIGGVVAKLKLYGSGSQAQGQKEEERFHKRLNDLAKVTSRGRLSPKSSSELTPSSELPESGAEVRPDFDRRHFGSMIPDSPYEAPDEFGVR